MTERRDLILKLAVEGYPYHDKHGFDRDGWIDCAIQDATTLLAAVDALEVPADTSSTTYKVTAVYPDAAVNQCDGCRRGLRISQGIHFENDRPVMACTADRYNSAQPERVCVWTHVGPNCFGTACGRVILPGPITIGALCPCGGRIEVRP